jgi:hypothetical protein
VRALTDALHSERYRFAAARQHGHHAHDDHIHSAWSWSSEHDVTTMCNTNFRNCAHLQTYLKTVIGRLLQPLFDQKTLDLEVNPALVGDSGVYVVVFVCEWASVQVYAAYIDSVEAKGEAWYQCAQTLSICVCVC